jgi:glycosyltransferase involved in cell wall biosynthesis
VSDLVDVTVIIPCRNEAGSLPGVLAAMPDGYVVVVVDNGSEDDTAEVALRHGATVVHEATPGYGSAVHAGVERATTTLVCVLDGDGSLDPRDLPRLVALVEGGADLAVGRRRPTTTSGWPLHARAANAVIAARLRQRFGIPVHDIGAIRCVRRDALLALNVMDRRSGYPLELLIRAAKANMRIEEIDVDYRPRTAGRSKVSGSFRGSFVAARDFLKFIR